MALEKNVNSYVTVAEADAYFVDRVHNTGWDTNAIIQEEALVTATGLLDLLRWEGQTVTLTQALAFPRIGSYYSKSRGRYMQFDRNSVDAPNLVKVATYELALHLVQNPDILNDTAQVEDLVIGSIKLYDIRPNSIIPNRIKRYISDYLVNSGSNSWFRSN